MIDNYNEVMEQWANPTVGECTSMTTIEPDMDMRRWCVHKTVTILANSDYYYTKAEVDHLLDLVTASGVTKQEVEEMIAVAIQDKADKAQVEALSAQVATNTERILNTYTKPEVNNLLASYYTKLQTNSMFGNYSKVEDTTLILNAENIN
jgi:hypothetical protein